MSDCRRCHQTSWFGVEEMPAAAAGTSSLSQLERPSEHVAGEVCGALESGAGTAETPLQGGSGVTGERQRLTPLESAQMAPAAARGVEAEEQLRYFDCGFEPRGQVDAQCTRTAVSIRAQFNTADRSDIRCVAVYLRDS